MISIGLSVYFNILVTDEKAVTTEISWVARSCTKQPSFEEIQTRHARQIFAGVFQDGVVQAAVMDVLYQLLDVAQGIEGSEASRESWLDLT